MSVLERRGAQRRRDGFTIPTRRRVSTVAHISGLALAVVAPGLALSGMIEVATEGDGAWALFISAALFAFVGGSIHRGTRLGDLSPKAIFASVAWSWMLVSVLGSLPFVLARTFSQEGVSRWVELSDAIFESVSGYTCTGSTVLTTLPDLGETDPVVGRGVLFYRQLTQWYGGMGFVQLVIAVLPVLGTRAMGFMGAEAPGPTADRLSPRAADTAAILWKVYAGVTALMAFGYWIAGMSLFDGVNHALSTAATGGFSTYNDSLGEYDSIPIEFAAIVAMMIGGTNFALHYLFLTKDRVVYFKDREFRTYLAMLAIATAVVTTMLTIGADVGDFGQSFRVAVFNVVSLGTSTGFGNAQGSGSPGDIVFWGASPLVILLVLMAIGGMSGSTAGGTKVIRVRVLASAAQRVVIRARHPRSVIPLRIGGDVVRERVVNQVTIFFMAYMALVVAGLLAVTALGGGLEESISGVIGSLGNMGPAFGDGGPTATFQDAFPAPARLVLAALMIIGRLELFAVLLMFAAPISSLRRALPNRQVN